MKKTRKLGLFLIMSVLIALVSSPLLATNWLDGQFVYPYNDNISLASDITSALTMAAPAAFAFVAPSSD